MLQPTFRSCVFCCLGASYLKHSQQFLLDCINENTQAALKRLKILGKEMFHPITKLVQYREETLFSFKYAASQLWIEHSRENLMFSGNRFVSMCHHILPLGSSQQMYMKAYSGLGYCTMTCNMLHKLPTHLKHTH